MNLEKMRKSARLAKDIKKDYDRALNALGVGNIGALKGALRNMMIRVDELYLEAINKRRRKE